MKNNSLLKTRYLSIIILVAVFSWSSWLVVINKLSPGNHTELSLLFFFVSIFIALSATFTLIVYLLRTKFLNHVYFDRIINISLRQGILLSLLAIFTLVFQLIRVLTWWTGGLLIIAIILLEYYFSSKESGAIY